MHLRYFTWTFFALIPPQVLSPRCLKTAGFSIISHRCWCISIVLNVTTASKKDLLNGRSTGWTDQVSLNTIISRRCRRKQGMNCDLGRGRGRVAKVFLSQVFISVRLQSHTGKKKCEEKHMFYFPLKMCAIISTENWKGREKRREREREFRAMGREGARIHSRKSTLSKVCRKLLFVRKSGKGEHWSRSHS